MSRQPTSRAEAARSANLGLRFLLELGGLAAVSFWGFRTGGAFRLLLGLGAPLLVATLWACFVAPKAAFPVSDAVRFTLQLAILTATVAALIAAGQPILAALFAVVAVLNGWLVHRWNQQ